MGLDRIMGVGVLVCILLLGSLLSVTTAEEPQTMEPGVSVSSIEELSDELSWGFQFSKTPFIVTIKANSYKGDQVGVVSLIYADGTCASYDAVGFKLFGSSDGGQSYIEIVDKVDVSSPTRCKFLPSSTIFGQLVVARSTNNVWRFAFSVIVDNSDYTYKFRAQFAKDT